VPADLKSRDIPLLLDLKMFYVAVGYDPTKGGLMFLEVTALDEKLRKLTQTEIDIDPDYGVGVYTLEQALQIPSCSFVDITVVASSNQTSCFRYFYADFAADNTVDDTVAMGIPGGTSSDCGARLPDVRAEAITRESRLLQVLRCEGAGWSWDARAPKIAVGCDAHVRRHHSVVLRSGGANVL